MWDIIWTDEQTKQQTLMKTHSTINQALGMLAIERWDFRQDAIVTATYQNPVGLGYKLTIKERKANL